MSKFDRPCVPNGYGLCSTHSVCDYMRATVAEYQAEVAKVKAQWVSEAKVLHDLTQMQGNRIVTLEKALRYAADCSTVEMVQDTVRGVGLDGQPGWRIETRDFAEDSEQHAIDYDDWKAIRGHGITLYSYGGFFTGYFEDASILWQESDETRPMFHVGIRSDPPFRTVIHPMHLLAWVTHLAGIFLPVQIVGRE